MMLLSMFTKPEKLSVYWTRLMEEMVQLGVKSLGIVILMSAFMGAVIVIQSATAIDAAWIPDYTVGFTAKQSIILEFSPTIMSLILAGKVGSNIASELGSMRVTEQIDALEIMGINTKAYLIRPKIIAAVLIFPAVIIFSMAFGFGGGWMAAFGTGLIPEEQYIFGIQSFYDDNLWMITYALIKATVFAFIITSVSSYHGYYTSGGALEVGRSSTNAVVYSSVLILLANLLLTQLLLI